MNGFIVIIAQSYFSRRVVLSPLSSQELDLEASNCQKQKVSKNLLGA